MSTPERLVELNCTCGTPHWEIDCDFRGMGGEEEPYDARTYTCPACGREGSGFTVLQKSPPEFFLQPHHMYPMAQAKFDKWVQVFREHFPDHPRLGDLGGRWRPAKPRWWQFWKR